MEQEEYSEEEHTELSTEENPLLTSKKKKRSRNSNSKRFSDEQVKSLESTFNRGSKLEPRKKLQLARDLGLQPRQVSIWFQNKRARWKSKQLEQEYRVLKANFDALYEQFESLKKEKESLLEQLQTVRSLLDNQQSNQSSSSRDSDHNGTENGGNRDKLVELKEDSERELYLDEHEIGANKSFRQREQEFVRLPEQGDNLLASPEHWRNLPSGDLLDEPCSPSNWWDL